MISSSSTNAAPSAPAIRTSRGRPGRHLHDRQPMVRSRRRRARAAARVQAERRQQRKRPRDVDRQRRQHRQDAPRERTRRAPALRIVRVASRRAAGSRAPRAPAAAPSRDEPIERRRRTRAPGRGPRRAAGPASGRRGRATCRRPRPPASSAGDAHHEELVEVRRGDRGELDALEQRRRRIGRLLEHALVERQPRQLAVDEQRWCRARVGASRDDSRRPDHELPAEHFDEHVGPRRRRHLLHRHVAGAVELAASRSLAPHAAARPRTFCRCSASSALATRRIAASLSTIRRGRCGRARCTAGGSSAAVRRR